MRRCFLVLAFIFCNVTVYASLDFNPACISAYKNILALKLPAARVQIAAEKKRNPQNAIPYLLDNYVDYFTLITTESKADFERLKNNKILRLNRIERDDASSPYYLYAQAEINLQWALIRGRFEEYFTSGIEINKAYQLLQANKKKFPQFLPNDKNIGMIQAILGSLPSGLKRTMSVFGLKGNTEAGVRILNNLLKKLPGSEYSHFYEETIFYWSYVNIDILHSQDSYPKIIEFTEQIDSSSLLRTYIRSYAGMKTAHNSEAIASLVKKPAGSAYQPYPYLDYLLGIARMHNLDAGAASDLEGYIRNYNGVNFVKDSYLNLGWLCLIRGDLKGYQQNIVLVKTRGFAYHEKDKQALNEANEPAPDTDLLKARLLFDGGYFQRALSQIKDRKAESFKLLRDRIEYCYRLGRIYHARGNDEAAITFYKYAINLGRNERFYFAANAALQIGMVYEAKKNNEQARTYYNAALNMKDHDYENSIENKAKDGLRRLGK